MHDTFEWVLFVFAEIVNNFVVDYHLLKRYQQILFKEPSLTTGLFHDFKINLAQFSSYSICFFSKVYFLLNYFK